MFKARPNPCDKAVGYEFAYRDFTDFKVVCLIAGVKEIGKGAPNQDLVLDQISIGSALGWVMAIPMQAAKSGCGEVQQPWRRKVTRYS